MTKVLNIAFTDLRMYFGERTNLVMATVLPVIMSVLLGGAFNVEAPTQLRFDILDQDETAQSQAFIDALRAENSTLLLCPMDHSEEGGCMMPQKNELTRDEMVTRLTDGVSAAVLIIPEGFGTALDSFTPVSLEYYSIGNLTTGDAVLQSVDAVLQEMNVAGVAAQIATGMGDRLTGPGANGTIFADETARAEFAQEAYASANSQWAETTVGVRYVLSAEGEQNSDENVAPSGYSQSVPGMATMFVLFTVLGGMSLLLEERKQWTLQRLVVMPISRAQILGGKILARFTTGILQFGLLFIVGLFVGLDFGNNIPALLLVVVTYTLCITALTFAMGTIVRTEMQAGGLVTLLSLVLAALGGAWWPLEIVPDFMQVMAHISPVAWAMDGFTQLLFYGGGLVDVLLPVGVLLAATAVLFALGISRFQYD